ncbi:hypothetical protein ACSBR1_030966 [Camellia fascicularis]
MPCGCPSPGPIPSPISNTSSPSNLSQRKAKSLLSPLQNPNLFHHHIRFHLQPPPPSSIKTLISFPKTLPPPAHPSPFSSPIPEISIPNSPFFPLTHLTWSIDPKSMKKFDPCLSISTPHYMIAPRAFLRTLDLCC